MSQHDDISKAVREGKIDHNNITAKDLRSIKIPYSTSTSLLSKHPERYEKVKDGVYRLKKIKK